MHSFSGSDASDASPRCGQLQHSCSIFSWGRGWAGLVQGMRWRGGWGVCRFHATHAALLPVVRADSWRQRDQVASHDQQLAACMYLHAILLQAGRAAELRRAALW